MLILLSIAGCTSPVTLPITPCFVAVIVEGPGETPVSKPVSVTLLFSLFVAHTDSSVTSLLLPSL